MPVGSFPKDLQPIARTLYAHYDNDGVDIGVADLANLFFSSVPANREFMEQVFENINKDNSSPDTVLTLIQGIRQKALLQELSQAAYDASDGVKPIEKVYSLMERLNKPEETFKDEISFISSNLEELAEKAILQPGLRWRLKTLNSMLGSLRKGDFGFLFARPETGKTTFLASEVTHMASQAKGPIIWFNNEEGNDKVMLRVIQAYFGVELDKLLSDVKGYQARYNKEMAGKILMPDGVTFTQEQVKKICEKINPSLIIFDQLDKIHTQHNDREDLRLGALYQWARELAKDYCPVIGVTQADGSGENVKWLTMGNVANAKTAKQAEADFILGIGKVTDAGYDNIRFLHASKNKLIGDPDTDPSKRHGRETVILDARVARYRDVQ